MVKTVAHLLAISLLMFNVIITFRDYADAMNSVGCEEVRQGIQLCALSVFWDCTFVETNYSLLLLINIYQFHTLFDQNWYLIGQNLTNQTPRNIRLTC